MSKQQLHYRAALISYACAVTTLAAAWLLTAATPPVTPGGYQVLSTYYAPDPRIVPSATSLITSGTSQINFAANVFTDPVVAGALCHAASNGKAVKAILDPSAGTTAIREYRSLISSGGSVWFNPMQNRIENHILTVDGGSCGTGNYYWSPTAVQAGNWFSTLGGTAVTGSFNSTFGSLQASGTRQM
jgi:hypothetical protein